MKKYASVVCSGLAAATIFAMPLQAVAEHAHHPDSAAAPTKPKAPEQTLKKMQGNVKKMQAQLDRLGKAKNEAEGQAILAEHMQTMRENMMLGRGMAGMDCQMMGGGMMGGKGHGAGHGMRGMTGGEGDHHATMVERMQQMEKRMDAMQSRMDQMAGPAAAK